jgi:hypothetical protein
LYEKCVRELLKRSHSINQLLAPWGIDHFATELVLPLVHDQVRKRLVRVAYPLRLHRPRFLVTTRCAGHSECVTKLRQQELKINATKVKKIDHPVTKEIENESRRNALKLGLAATASAAIVTSKTSHAQGAGNLAPVQRREHGLSCYRSTCRRNQSKIP